MYKLTIAPTWTSGGTITTSPANYERLTAATLPGCPFGNYNAWELLQDLISMYSWKLKPGTPCELSDFLTLCNDAHAEAYRAILEG